MRYFLHLSYDGFSYQGWQRQKNTNNTIQEILEIFLSEVFKEKITVLGCGRTDAGVHASQYIAHIDVTSRISNRFIEILNHRLPGEITIHEFFKVDDQYHARYDATTRQYQYYITLKRDPFLTKYTAYYGDKKINPKLLEEAIILIKAYSDFSNVCKQPDKNNHNICHIYETKVDVSENKQMIRITLSANRFLRGMVRILVKKALDYSTSKISLPEFKSILANEFPRKFKDMAYPQGLYLSKIQYPFLEFENKSIMKKLLDKFFIP